MFLGIQAERIRPVLLGVDLCFILRTVEETRPVLNRHDLVHPRLLPVATLRTLNEPAKLHYVLIMQLPQQVRKHVSTCAG